MNTTALLVLAVVVVVIAVGVFLYIRRRRSDNLRKQFGPEYKRAVDQYGDQRKAEVALAAREERVRKLHIRGLTADEQSRFSDTWKKTQARFVDEPSRAVSEADGLVKELMQARGYPVGDFEQRAAEIAKDRARPETRGQANGKEEAATLFPENEAKDFRTRWTDIQTGFVDEPRRSVEQADALVAEVIKRLANGFAEERSKLEGQWGRGDDVSTEDLRVALRRYRSFFDRLLNV